MSAGIPWRAPPLALALALALVLTAAALSASQPFSGVSLALPDSPSAATRAIGSSRDGSPELVRPASTVLLPIASVFVPGFGQLAQRRHVPGLAYSGAALSGLVIFAESAPPSMTTEDLLFDRPGARSGYYGLSLFQGAGFMSAWDVFQVSVPTLQQEEGKFLFLNPARRESFADLLRAPFTPEYLVRPTTWLPLAALAAYFAVDVPGYRREEDAPGVRWTGYEPGDAFFTGALSMNAGVTEEAVFRGYMFPLFHQWSGERFWISNSAQAALFAAAHVGTVDVPVVQGGMGLYLGWMTRRNQWTLGQAVALHFWWDVIAVTATMFTRHQVPVSLGSVSVPVDW